MHSLSANNECGRWLVLCGAPLSGKVGWGLLQGKQLSCLPISPPTADPLSIAFICSGGDQLSAFIKHSHTNQLDSAPAKTHIKLQCMIHYFEALVTF